MIKLGIAEEIGSAGLEPARTFVQKILSLLCLPFHHEPEKGTLTERKPKHQPKDD